MSAYDRSVDSNRIPLVVTGSLSETADIKIKHEEIFSKYNIVQK